MCEELAIRAVDEDDRNEHGPPSLYLSSSDPASCRVGSGPVVQVAVHDGAPSDRGDQAVQKPGERKENVQASAGEGCVWLLSP